MILLIMLFYFMRKVIKLSLKSNVKILDKMMIY